MSMWLKEWCATGMLLTLMATSVTSIAAASIELPRSLENEPGLDSQPISRGLLDEDILLDALSYGPKAMQVVFELFKSWAQIVGKHRLKVALAFLALHNTGASTALPGAAALSVTNGNQISTNNGSTLSPLPMTQGVIQSNPALSDQVLDVNDLPELVPVQTITEPVHVKIKDVAYSQYVSALFGGSGYEEIKANSGYVALYNGIISSMLSYAEGPEKCWLLNKMHSQLTATPLFVSENSTWRSIITQSRLERILAEYLQEQLLLHLSGTHIEEIDPDDSAWHPFILRTKKGAVVINDDATPLQRAEIECITKLIPRGAQRAAQTNFKKEFIIAPADLCLALEHEAILENPAAWKWDKPIAIECGEPEKVIFVFRLYGKYLATVPILEGELKQGKNHNELYVNGVMVHSLTYGPSPETSQDGSWFSAMIHSLTSAPSPAPFQDGSWLSVIDIAATLGKINFLGYPEKTTVTAVLPKNICCLEYPSKTLLEEFRNNLTLSWLQAELKKKPQKFQALLLIKNFGEEWTSCAITKMQDKVTFTVTDPVNKDRQNEEVITKLVDLVQEALQDEQETCS